MVIARQSEQRSEAMDDIPSSTWLITHPGTINQQNLVPAVSKFGATCGVVPCTVFAKEFS